MKKQKKMDYHEHEPLDQERFPIISNVASANECTGLMYRSPQDEEERQALQRLSSMAIPDTGGEAEEKAGRAQNSRPSSETACDQ